MQGPNLDANIQMSSTDVPLLLHSLLSVHSQLRGGGGPSKIQKGGKKDGALSEGGTSKIPSTKHAICVVCKKGKQLIQPLGCCESMQQCPLDG